MNGHQNRAFSCPTGVFKNPRKVNGYGADYALCYDIKLTKDEGWKLVKQFILSAGFWFLSMNVGSKILSALMESTGFGYGVGVAMDAATSAAFAWAIGATSKEYFQREYLGKSKLSKDELGKIFRDAFKDQKNK